MTEKTRPYNQDLEERSSTEETPNGNGYSAVLKKHNLVGAIPEEIYNKIVERAKLRIDQNSSEEIRGLSPYTADSLAETYKDGGLTSEMLDEDLRLAMQNGSISRGKTLAEKLNGESQRLEKMLWAFYDEIPEGYDVSEDLSIEVRREDLPKEIRDKFENKNPEYKKSRIETLNIGDLIEIDETSNPSKYRGVRARVVGSSGNINFPYKTDFGSVSVNAHEVYVLTPVEDKKIEIPPQKIIYYIERHKDDLHIGAHLLVGEIRTPLFYANAVIKKKFLRKNREHKTKFYLRENLKNSVNAQRFCTKILNLRDDDCQKELKDAVLFAYDHLEEALYADVKKREEALEKE